MTTRMMRRREQMIDKNISAVKKKKKKKTKTAYRCIFVRCFYIFDRYQLVIGYFSSVLCIH